MKTKWIVLILFIALLGGGLWLELPAQLSKSYPEITLKIGDTYEQVQQASTYKMSRALSPDGSGFWTTDVREPASLHFNDPDHSFVTPPAKFLGITASRGIISSIRMSPQVETLPLKETLDVVADLEQQLEKSGWKICKPTEYAAYKDDHQITEKLLNGKSPNVFWRAGDKYMLTYDAGRFSGDPAKGNERYLITISLGGGIWLPACLTPEEEEVERKRIEALPKSPPPPPTPVSDWLKGIKK